MRNMLTNLEIRLLQKEIYEQISEILKLGVIYDLWSSLYPNSHPLGYFQTKLSIYSMLHEHKVLKTQN